MLISIWFHKKY